MSERQYMIAERYMTLLEASRRITELEAEVVHYQHKAQLSGDLAESYRAEVERLKTLLAAYRHYADLEAQEGGGRESGGPSSVAPNRLSGEVPEHDSAAANPAARTHWCRDPECNGEHPEDLPEVDCGV